MTTKTLSRDKLIKELKVEFPDGWFKTSEEFDGKENAVWSGEGWGIDGLPAFDYYAMSHELFPLGVNHKLVAFLEKRGWFAECYDAGTYFFYKI